MFTDALTESKKHCIKMTELIDYDARTWFCSTVKLLGLQTLFRIPQFKLDPRPSFIVGSTGDAVCPAKATSPVEIAGLTGASQQKHVFFVRFILIRMWPPCARGPYVLCCLLLVFDKACRAQEHPI